ncbi:MAG: site-2 protease family protein [Patescibacteria group bacterium]|nr:site-2 protease family protein [Patescibacteria group bacterium]
MVFTIILAFISLIGLIVLHEFSHFILAKRFGVKIEEFGIFLPPRLIGKKIGETIYSLNLLPFGAFVKLYGEVDHEKKEYWSFTQKPIWQRVLIVIGGVVSFWIISAILLSIVMGLGTPTTISDKENGNLIEPKVQIAAVAPNSPAEIAGIKPGDTIKKFSISNLQFSIDKVKEVQELTEKYKGEEVTLTIERGKEIFEVSLVPRVSPPEGEGAMGVALVRTTIKSYPWEEAPIQGIIATGNLTVAIIQGWARALVLATKREPTGVQLMGPVGILGLFAQIGQLGINYFLQFVAIISIYMALFNVLPIPALDGGKLVFLGIEALRKRPVSSKTEQQITTFFFVLLIGLIILVTIKDISRLF